MFSATVAFAEGFRNLCIVNGELVNCADLAQVAGLGLIGILAILVTVISAFIFWIAMLVHAIVKPVKLKIIWIIVIIFFQFIGALVYYIAVKRPFSKKQHVS